MDTVLDASLIALIGLIAGLVGGLTGLGGSVIMLPGLAFIVGYADETHAEQHTYQAAAMAVNFLVAVPAVWRHTHAGAIRKPLLYRLLPPAVLFIILGVLASDQFQGEVLVKILAVVIAFMVVISEIAHRVRARRDDDATRPMATPAVIGTGVTTGFLAGLLGIGGGVITVTGLQALGRVPIRQAIAASAAVMCLTAPVGAGIKMATLHTHDQSVIGAVELIGLLGPAAVVGALMGASLVHRLPVRLVRPVVSVILLIAAARLGGLI